MSAAQKDLTIICGRDFFLAITNQTELANPFSLTGYIAVLTVKKVISDPDASALYQGTPFSASLDFGQLTFKIPHTVTTNWWTGGAPVSTTVVYDVAYADTGSPKNWSTVLYGAVILQEPVTIAIPGG
jgi:hypothetical protein